MQWNLTKRLGKVFCALTDLQLSNHRLAQEVAELAENSCTAR